jgi:hypothetical protein
MKSDLPSTTRLVLQTLANFMDHTTGLAYPGIRRLATSCGVSPRTVCTHLAAASREGWIIVSKRMVNGHPTRSHEYQPALPAAAGRSKQQVHRSSLNPITSDVEPRALSQRRQVQQNLPRESTRQLQSEFDTELWDIFPRHPNSSRTAALAAFRVLSAEEKVACLAGAVRFAIRFEAIDAPREQTEERLKFVPSLATWIRQRRWEREGGKP